MEFVPSRVTCSPEETPRGADEASRCSRCSADDVLNDTVPRPPHEQQLARHKTSGTTLSAECRIAKHIGITYKALLCGLHDDDQKGVLFSGLT